MVQKKPGRPRGRPRSFDADAVLLKARDAFWAAGYAATSLDDLSAATGLNRPSLYGAFGDKHALYLATLERTRAEMMTSVRAGLARPGCLEEVLTAFFQAASAVYRGGASGQRGCFLIGTGVTESLPDPDVRALLARAFAELDAAFAERIAQAGGRHPEALGRVASAILHALAVRARVGADAEALRAIWEPGVALICKA